MAITPKPEPTPAEVVEAKTEPQQRPQVTKVLTETYMYAGQIYPANEREPQAYMIPAELADGIEAHQSAPEQSRQSDIFAKPVRS